MKHEAMRFLLVGMASTGTHFVVLALLYQGFNIGILYSTFIAFLVAFMLSYVANYHYTFKSSGDHRIAILKFLVSSGIGLLWNLLIMYLLVEQFAVNYVVAFILMSAVVATNNFILGKIWVFSSQPRIQDIPPGN